MIIKAYCKKLTSPIFSSHLLRSTFVCKFLVLSRHFFARHRLWFTNTYCFELGCKPLSSLFRNPHCM